MFNIDKLVYSHDNLNSFGRDISTIKDGFKNKQSTSEINDKINQVSNYLLDIDYFKNEKDIQRYFLEKLEGIVEKKQDELPEKFEKIGELFKKNAPISSEEQLKVSISLNSKLQKLYSLSGSDSKNILFEFNEILKQINNQKMFLNNEMLARIDENINNVVSEILNKPSVLEDLFQMNDTNINDVLMLLDSISIIKLLFSSSNLGSFATAYEKDLKPMNPIQLVMILTRVSSFNAILFIDIAKCLPENKRSIENIQNMIEGNSNIDLSKIHENYRVRVTNFKKNYGNSNQKLYSELMHKGIIIADSIAKETADDQPWDFNQRIEFFANYRRAMAIELGLLEIKDAPNSRIGYLRRDLPDGGENLCVTPAVGVYAKLGVDLNARFEKDRQSISPGKGPGYEIRYPTADSPPSESSFTNEEKNEIQIKDAKGMITTLGTLKDKDGKEVQIPLSRIVLYRKEVLHRGMNNPTVVSLFHSTLHDADLAMKHVLELFQEFMKETNSPEKLKVKLGEMFWWICQAKPWALGDPSIAELFIRELWLEKTGTLLPPWKRDLIPWEKTVTITDVNEFKEKFEEFFDESIVME